MWIMGRLRVVDVLPIWIEINMEVQHKLLAAMIEFNNYNTTNLKLYLQGIVLQWYLIKQKKPRHDKWKPEFHVRGVSDKNNKPYFFCQNGLSLLFCLGYQKWKTILAYWGRIPSNEVCTGINWHWNSKFGKFWYDVTTIQIETMNVSTILLEQWVETS